MRISSFLCTFLPTRSSSSVQYKLASAPLPPCTFDCVVDKGTLAAIPETQQLLAARAMLAELKPAGTLVSVWLAQSRRDALTLMGEAGFVEVEVVAEEEVAGQGILVITAEKELDMEEGDHDDDV
jgi:hypothetical protein